MRNDLNRAAQVFPAALFADDRGIDFAGCHVAVLREIDVNKPFIVPQVQVGFRPIVGYKHFAMLIRTHGSRVYINIRIEFLNRHLQTSVLEQPAQRSGGNPFAQGRHDTTRYKNILCHCITLLNKVQKFRRRCVYRTLFSIIKTGNPQVSS
ncbi:hypothetical protein D3C73_689420 [compost metagenome]